MGFIKLLGLKWRIRLKLSLSSYIGTQNQVIFKFPVSFAPFPEPKPPKFSASYTHFHVDHMWNKSNWKSNNVFQD